MNRINIGRGSVSSSATIERIQEFVADEFSSHARHMLTGCVAGMTLDLASRGGTVSAGEAYFAGRRYRLPAPVTNILAGVARPNAPAEKWVAVVAKYATVTTGTVRDRDAGTRPELIEEICTISVVEGAAASAPARPDIPEGAILVGEYLLDSATELASIVVDGKRRTECHPVRLQGDVDRLWVALGALQAQVAATQPRAPDRPAAPAGSSPSVLLVRWTYVVPSANNSPVTSMRLRWRFNGDTQWDANRVIEQVVDGTTAVEHAVPDTSRAVEAQAQAIAAAGTSGWSPLGTLAAASITPEPAYQNRRYESPGAYSLTWQYRSTGKARVMLRGGQGGGGTDGTAGTSGGNAVAKQTGPRWYPRIVSAIQPDGTPFVSESTPGGVGVLGVYYSSEANALIDAGNWKGRLEAGGWSSVITGTVYRASTNIWHAGADGADGVPGEAGSPGVASSLSVAAVNLLQSAAGGSGGAAGDPGQGGAGGSGPNGQGAAGTPGGQGKVGAPGAALTVEISGLQYGHTIGIVVGAGGAGSPVGSDGLVSIEPVA